MALGGLRRTGREDQARPRGRDSSCVCCSALWRSWLKRKQAGRVYEMTAWSVWIISDRLRRQRQHGDERYRSWACVQVPVVESSGRTRRLGGCDVRHSVWAAIYVLRTLYKIPVRGAACFRAKSQAPSGLRLGGCRRVWPLCLRPSSLAKSWWHSRPLDQVRHPDDEATVWGYSQAPRTANVRIRLACPESPDATWAVVG